MIECDKCKAQMEQTAKEEHIPNTELDIQYIQCEQCGKGDKEMMAKLWVTEILSKDTIEEAKEEYNRVPRLLKEKVKKLLINAGMEEITE